MPRAALPVRGVMRTSDGMDIVIESCFAVGKPEHADGIVGTLGRAEEEVARRVQGEVEGRADVLLQLSVEVDEQVPAGDEVDAREWRILEKAVLGEAG